MIRDQLYIYKNKALLNEGFTQFIRENVMQDNKKVSIALSGGNTPKTLFEYWSKYYKAIMPWNNMLFFWGDERCVSPDDKMSNYGMTNEHLFKHIHIPSDNIFRIQGERIPTEEAERYSKILDDHLTYSDNIPQFDLVILGLGDDGHTASIFPDQIDLWNSNENCIVATHPESGMKRVTVTGKIINNARTVVFLVTGDNKAEKVKEVIQYREEFFNKYPAARVNPKSGELFWFVDESAGRLL